MNLKQAQRFSPTRMIVVKYVFWALMWGLAFFWFHHDAVRTWFLFGIPLLALLDTIVVLSNRLTMERILKHVDR